MFGNRNWGDGGKTWEHLCQANHTDLRLYKFDIKRFVYYLSRRGVPRRRVRRYQLNDATTLSGRDQRIDGALSYLDLIKNIHWCFKRKNLARWCHCYSELSLSLSGEFTVKQSDTVRGFGICEDYYCCYLSLFLLISFVNEFDTNSEETSIFIIMSRFICTSIYLIWQHLCLIFLHLCGTFMC